MKKADGYLVIPKELIKGFEDGDINNTHIFDCSCDSQGKWRVTKTSRCSNAEYADIHKLSAKDIITNANDIRQMVTNIENKGFRTVCGQCVATLYADEK